MLIWVAALHCEAKPVIDYYRLKKSSRHNGFDLYQNEDMLCVISGMGKISAAAATAWAAVVKDRGDSICWINLGTAGAADKAIGDIFRLGKITDSQSNRNYYPVPAFTSRIPQIACISLDQPSDDYHADAIFDMEASAFFATATRFSSAELVHGLKVISDNRHQQTGFDKKMTSELVHRQIEQIDHFAEDLQILNREMIDREIRPELWKQVLQQAHFSQTQQARLKSLLIFLLDKAGPSDSLLDDIRTLTSSRRILETLERRCHKLSRNL